jgi:hypothetical protein
MGHGLTSPIFTAISLSLRHQLQQPLKRIEQMQRWLKDPKAVGRYHPRSHPAVPRLPGTIIGPIDA